MKQSIFVTPIAYQFNRIGFLYAKNHNKLNNGNGIELSRWFDKNCEDYSDTIVFWHNSVVIHV